MAKKRSTDFNELIKAMKAWADPNGPAQKKILADLSIDPVAFKTDYTEPVRGRSFEINFFKRSEIEKRKKQLQGLGEIQVLSFAEGMRLCQHPNCFGGSTIYKEGKILIALNPALQDEGKTNHLIM